MATAKPLDLRYLIVHVSQWGELTRLLTTRGLLTKEVPTTDNTFLLERKTSPERDARKLTEREMQVLVLASNGFTNKRIATAMLLSEDTVKTHMRMLMPKLCASDRAHAVGNAFRAGLLPTGLAQ